MDVLEVLRINFLSPAVMAFALGIIAVQLKSDLEIPEQVYTVLSLYLLFAIGLKGGFDLAKSPVGTVWGPALVAALLGAGIPLLSYAILHFLGRFNPADAAATALHFGAVSAATLSAVITFLDEVAQPFEGFMPAMYVIMEIPAITVGLLIAASQVDRAKRVKFGSVLRSALSAKSLLLLGGGVLIGYFSGGLGEQQVGLFYVGLFPGALTLFLLEMGTLVGRRLGDIKEAGLFLLGFGVLMPLLHGFLGVVFSMLVGLSLGGAVIMATLAASASFITAPAAVQTNIPTANAGYYLTAALVITFPFNLALGIPIYFEMATLLYGL